MLSLLSQPLELDDHWALSRASLSKTLQPPCPHSRHKGASCRTQEYENSRRQAVWEAEPQEEATGPADVSCQARCGPMRVPPPPPLPPTTASDKASETAVRLASSLPEGFSATWGRIPSWVLSPVHTLIALPTTVVISHASTGGLCALCGVTLYACWADPYPHLPSICSILNSLTLC